MIVNIRGVSGSGKSTLARKICELYEKKTPFFMEGRKKPLYYIFEKEGHRPLAIIGHYESPCGGCDTLRSYDQIFDLVVKLHEGGNNVIYEGLLISGDVKRTAALHNEGLPLKVVLLNLSLEECLASVNIRRRAKNPDAEDVNPKNTESKHRQIKSVEKRLGDAGVKTVSKNREEAFEFIKKELGYEV